MHARHLLAFVAALILCGSAQVLAAEEARFDVAVTDAPARTFFEGLVDGTPYNIVLEPGITGKISLKLHNVTVPEVLDAVREAYGYDYRRMASGYVLVPPTLQTRIFQINYLDLERRGTSRTRIASGAVSESKQQGQSGQGNMNGGGAPQTGGLSEPPGSVFNRGGNDQHGAQNIGEITGSSISTRSSSDFWHDLSESLHSLVGSDGGHSVVVNSQSGIIAVRATPRELREVTEFLHQVQNVSTREVVLEAKILEVELSDGFQAGINWGLVGRKGGQTISGFQTGPQNGFGSANLFSQPSQVVPIGPGNPITSAATNTLGGAFALAINTADFSAYIEALSTQGKTRVLSSPRVSTLNNQKAVIKAGSDEFFVTGVSSNTVVGTASATNRDVELTPFFSGIALDVTPQISAEGEVILHIHPSVSDVTEKIKTLTVAGVTDSLPLAFSQTRESDSVVKAKSGQLIVIGGLMRTTKTKEDYRTPLLGDIPVLGNLFKSQQKSEVRSELVILLRPIVIETDEQMKQLTDEPLERATLLDPKAGAGVR